MAFIPKDLGAAKVEVNRVHEPVLYGSVIEQLTAAGIGTYLDATFGDGGHSCGLLEADKGNRVIALDWDPEAVERGHELVARYEGRLIVRHINFRNLDQVEGEDFVGVLFDFGVSSHHLNDARRGFSFRGDGPLDMRLNTGIGESAEGFLNRASEQELVVAVRNYGEEVRWRRVVQAIIEARGSAALGGTLAFAKLVEEAVGGRRPGDKIHPATRTFQGIRIAVNEELMVIEEALPKAFARLREGGRLAAISFHSLEDRIVKRFMRRMCGKAEHARDSLPEQLRKRHAEQVTRKPIMADLDEVARNPRARSAKLRVIKKLKEAA